MAIAFAAMEVAAHLMTQVHQDGRLLLLPHCDLRAVTETLPALASSADLSGLILNSLLVPLDLRLSDTQHVRFSHQLFQEFFLARYLVKHPDEIPGALRLPLETELFVREME